MADSRYSLLVCEALLRDGSLRLDRYFELPLDPERFPDLAPSRYPYQVEPVGGHLYSFFPPGTHLLTVPLYALLRPFGIAAVDAGGRYDFQREERAQAVLAAMVTAGLAVALFAMARTLLPPGWSLLVALGSAFATPMWSTASRALWSDTWGIALLGVSLHLLVRAEVAGRRPNLPLLATLLAWMFFVKPPYAIPIAAISVLVLRRGRCLPYLAVGLAWLLAFVGYSWSLYGRPLPTYYMTRQLVTDMIWPSLAGGLASPSRGLLTCVPIVGFVVYLAARRVGPLVAAGLAAVAAGSIFGHLLLMAFFPVWWGGHGFGPRYMTGLVPWFALLAVLALRARLDAGGGRLRMSRPEALAGCLLLSLSVAIHARGAAALETSAWNYSPSDVNLHPRRLWDWAHLQALAGLVPPLYELGATVTASHPSADLFFRAGFGGREGNGRQTIADRAELWFDLREPGPATLSLDLEPDRSSGSRALVGVEINGRPVGSLRLDAPERAVHDIPLPNGVLAHRNRLALVLSDPPQPLGQVLRLFAVRISGLHPTPSAPRRYY
jgi:hypothetical protein